MNISKAAFIAWATAVLAQVGVKADDQAESKRLSNINPSRVNNTPVIGLPTKKNTFLPTAPISTKGVEYTQEADRMGKIAQIREAIDTTYDGDLNKELQDLQNNAIAAINRILDEALGRDDLTSTEFDAIMQKVNRNLEVAQASELLKCEISLKLIVGSSGNQISFYQNSKSLAVQMLSLIDMGLDSMQSSYTQFSVRTTSTPWTIDRASLVSGINAMQFQGGGALLATALKEHLEELTSSAIIPTADKPLVINIFTDGRIQDDSTAAGYFDRIRSAANGHVKFVVTFVEGSEGIDDVTIAKHLLPTDLAMSFREPDAFGKATRAMSETIQLFCASTSNAPTISPTTVKTGSPSTTSAPTIPPTTVKTGSPSTTSAPTIPPTTAKTDSPSTTSAPTIPPTTVKTDSPSTTGSPFTFTPSLRATNSPTSQPTLSPTVNGTNVTQEEMCKGWLIMFCLPWVLPRLQWDREEVNTPAPEVADLEAPAQSEQHNVTESGSDITEPLIQAVETQLPAQSQIKNMQLLVGFAPVVIVNAILRGAHTLGATASQHEFPAIPLPGGYGIPLEVDTLTLFKKLKALCQKVEEPAAVSDLSVAEIPGAVNSEVVDLDETDTRPTTPVPPSSPPRPGG